MKIFILLIGITGVYVSSAFVRLELFASISLIILTSIALSILTKEIFQINSPHKFIFKFSYVIIILTLFIIPLTFPTESNWINSMDFPPTILNGATHSPATNDWLETLEWIKLNTPENAVIASWWDYGYWIQTMGERASLSDNSTVNDHIIKNIAKMLLSSPNDGWQMLQEMQADYIVVFVAGQKLDAQYDNEPLYLLNGGGDESKKAWFIRIC